MVPTDGQSESSPGSWCPRGQPASLKHSGSTQGGARRRTGRAARADHALLLLLSLPLLPAPHTYMHHLHLRLQLHRLRGRR
eukprot:2776682-Prymnesium_polylepis.1